MQIKRVLGISLLSCGLLGISLASISGEETTEESSRVVRLTREYYVGEWVGGNLLYWYRLEMKADGSAVFGYVYGFDDPRVYRIAHWELPEGKPISMEPQPCETTGKTNCDILHLVVSNGEFGLHLLVCGSDWKQEAPLYRAQRVEEAQCKLKKAFLESLNKACTNK